MDPNLLTWIVFFPLVGVILILALPKEQKNAIRSIAVGTSIITLILTIFAWIGFDRTVSGMQFVESYMWINLGDFQIQYALGVDGLSLPLILLVTLISTLAIIASLTIKDRVKEYFTWILILMTGLLGVFLAQDLFLFFLFFELTLIPVFFLINIWGGKGRHRAAFKFIIYNGLGSAVMVMAFLFLAYKAFEATAFSLATFNISALADIYANPEVSGVLTDGLKAGIFLTLLIAFAVKLPIIPLHTWLPNAYVEAPTGVTMMLAGVMSKMGAYGLLRISYGILPDQAVHFATFIAILGVVNILYGAFIALVQTDLKKLIAYSSISHLGIVLLGVASVTEAGLQGAVFQLVSHGVIVSLLFFMVGAIHERTKTRTISELGGLSKSVPILAGFTLAAAMASLGLPGLSGFVSELLAFIGIFGASAEIIPAARVIGVLGAIGLIITAAYLLWAMQRTTFGQMDDKYIGLPDARPMEYIPMIGLLGISLLIGVYPSILSDVINTTVIDIVSKIGG